MFFWGWASPWDPEGASNSGREDALCRWSCWVWGIKAERSELHKALGSGLNRGWREGKDGKAELGGINEQPCPGKVNSGGVTALGHGLAAQKAPKCTFFLHSWKAKLAGKWLGDAGCVYREKGKKILKNILNTANQILFFFPHRGKNSFYFCNIDKFQTLNMDNIWISAALGCLDHPLSSFPYKLWIFGIFGILCTQRQCTHCLEVSRGWLKRWK